MSTVELHQQDPTNVCNGVATAVVAFISNGRISGASRNLAYAFEDAHRPIPRFCA